MCVRYRGSQYGLQPLGSLTKLRYTFGWGGAQVGSAIRRTKARRDLRRRCRGLQPPDGAR